MSLRKKTQRDGAAALTEHRALHKLLRVDLADDGRDGRRVDEARDGAGLVDGVDHVRGRVDVLGRALLLRVLSPKLRARVHDAVASDEHLPAESR